jgi:aryl-alcohol dehydrogenase-like predicted oxidoreductase
VALVRQDVDLGVNVLDTAEVYGTEEIVGKAIQDIPRPSVVVSTKKAFPLNNPAHPAVELRKGLEQSLRRLKTDYIDLYHVHGVEPQDYPYVAERLVPEMLKLKKEGKIRFLGITEAFVEDMRHSMLERALREGFWDAVMVGFNILNQTARAAVLQAALQQNIGVLVMFAVRRALSQPARLKEIWAELKQKGLLDPEASDGENPLDLLLREGKVSSIPEAAYRFCRHEPGVHVVLTGTGSPDHLRANIESLQKPPLPEEALKRLRETFAKVDFISGN